MASLRLLGLGHNAPQGQVSQEERSIKSGGARHIVTGYVHHRHRYDDHECLDLSHFPGSEHGGIGCTSNQLHLQADDGSLHSHCHKLADIVGKKRIFVIGLIIYGTGTTIASLVQT